MLWKSGNIFFYWHSELFTILYKCLYIHNKVWDIFGFLLNTDDIDKDQCSKNLLNQAFPLWQKYLVSCFLNPLMHFDSHLVTYCWVPGCLPCGEGWDFYIKDLSELLMCLFWWLGITGLLFHWCTECKRVITVATASVAQLPTLFMMFSENILIMSKVGLGHQSQKELPLRGYDLLS